MGAVRIRSGRALGLSLIAAMLTFALWTLVRRPMLGIADNGDFWRITQSVGLASDVPDRMFRHNFVRRTFVYVEPRWEKLVSSAALVAGAARILSRVIKPGDPVFDLRALGLVYWALLAAGVLCAVRGKVPLLLVTLWVWILVDPNYLLMLNSFYSEPLLFLSVACIGALLARGAWADRRGFIALCVVSLLGANTKAPYVLLPLTVLVAILCVHGFTRRARLVLLAAVACIPPALLFLLPTEALRDLARVNRFNTVFFGVTRASSQPPQTLDRFGVPPVYHDLAGKHFFAVDRSTHTDDLDESLARIGLWRILGFYGTQPGALGYAVGQVGTAMTVSRLRYAGHFERTTGAERAEYRVPWQFSSPRDVLLRGRPWLIGVALLASAVWIVGRLLRGGRNEMLTAEVFLWLTAVSQGPVVVLGDGFFELNRHLILGRFALDLLVATILVDLVGRLHDRAGSSSVGRCPRCLWLRDPGSIAA